MSFVGYNPTGPFVPYDYRNTVPYPHTIDPFAASGVQAFGGTNRTNWTLARNCTGLLTNLHIYAGTQSGNIAVGVYNSTGSGMTLAPSARVGVRGGTTGRAVADGVTNGTATVTSATLALVATDLGKAVTGTDIPANSYIGIINSATSFGLSSVANANTPVSATGSHSGNTITLATGIACPPASALATIALDAPITLDPTINYWFAIFCDNTTATFARAGLVAGATGPGVHWQQASSTPCPDPAVPSSTSGILHLILGS